MTIGNSDKEQVRQAVQSGGSVDTNGMNSARAEQIRAEERRLRAEQTK